jgi:peroxiredoxin
MNNYKVAFNVTKENVPKYFEFTLKKVMEYNEKENFVLPVPATYLIGKDKKIKYVQYDPDYKNRSNIEDVLRKLN